WSGADGYLQAASDAGVARNPLLADRHRKLAEELRAERERHPAITLGEWRRIGRMLFEPTWYPPDSDPPCFWSKGALCVQQQGPLASRQPFMRCYDPLARHWGGRSRIARGPLDQAPKTEFHIGANVCLNEGGWDVEGVFLGAAGSCEYDFFPDE